MAIAVLEDSLFPLLVDHFTLNTRGLLTRRGTLAKHRTQSGLVRGPRIRSHSRRRSGGEGSQPEDWAQHAATEKVASASATSCTFYGGHGGDVWERIETSCVEWRRTKTITSIKATETKMFCLQEIHVDSFCVRTFLCFLIFMLNAQVLLRKIRYENVWLDKKLNTPWHLKQTQA